MSTSNASSLLIPKRPIGPFRGSVLGFLAGVCTVSAIGFYTLFDKVRWRLLHLFFADRSRSTRPLPLRYYNP